MFPLEVSWLEYSLFLLFLRLGLENLSWMLWNPKSLFIDGNLDKAHLFHRRDITQIFIWTWWSTKISQILDRDALETWSTTLETLLAMSHIGWKSPKMSSYLEFACNVCEMRLFGWISNIVSFQIHSLSMRYPSNDFVFMVGPGVQPHPKLKRTLDRILPHPMTVLKNRK